MHMLQFVFLRNIINPAIYNYGRNPFMMIGPNVNITDKARTTIIETSVNIRDIGSTTMMGPNVNISP